MTKLELEAGKYYRTRDGQKIGPMRVHRDGDCMKSEGEKETGLWNFDGSPFFSFAYDSPQLIAEWSDTPALKVGDKVKVVAGYGPLFNGRIGIVTHVEGDDAYVASKSNLPKDYHQGDDFHLYFWGRELEPIPTIGTLAEIGAQVGDEVEFVEWGFDTTYTRAIGMHYKHCGEKLVSDIGTYFHYGDALEHKWRIVSRASDAKSTVELSVDLDEAIKQVVAESRSGPVQLRKVIVPGVYGKVRVETDGPHIKTYIEISDYMTRADLTEAIATLTAIRDAL